MTTFNPFDEASPEGVPAALRSLEMDIGLPDRFLDKVHEEGDWSLVIQVHALFEATVARLIMLVLDRHELEEVFGHIEMGNTRYGKIAIAHRLGLLNENERRFLRTLSELRNDLVHDIRNVTFEFKTHYEGLDTNKKKNFREGFGYMLSEDGIKKISDAAANTFASNPRRYFWQGVIFTLAVLHLQSDTAKTAGEVRRTEIEVAKQYEMVRREMEKKTGQKWTADEVTAAMTLSRLLSEQKAREAAERDAAMRKDNPLFPPSETKEPE